MGGRTGKTINYIGAAPGAPESGATPQAVVSQGQPTSQVSGAQVSQGPASPASPTVQQG
jgi:hypothetical protein